MTKVELEAEVARLQGLLDGHPDTPALEGVAMPGFGRVALDRREGGDVHVNVDAIDLIETSPAGEARLVMRSGREVEVKNPADVVLSRIDAAVTAMGIGAEEDEDDDE